MVGAIAIVKWICWLALALVCLSFVALFAPLALGLCVEHGGGQALCDAPIWRTVYEWGFTGVVLSFTSVVPAALAALGIGFLLIEIWRALRR